MMIAQNAQPILDARLKGLRPADMVVVSLLGPVVVDNPTVFAEVGKTYDWRWCKGLDVCIYLHDALDWPELVKAVALARPEHLSLWNHVDQWGAKVFLVPTESDLAKPVRRWSFELDFSVWHDFQNIDFVKCTKYQRNNTGVPYAVSN